MGYLHRPFRMQVQKGRSYFAGCRVSIVSLNDQHRVHDYRHISARCDSFRALHAVGRMHAHWTGRPGWAATPAYAIVEGPANWTMPALYRAEQLLSPHVPPTNEDYRRYEAVCRCPGTCLSLL